MPTLILCFHRVADPQQGGRSLLAISPEDFRRTLELVGARYRFIDLEEGSKPSTEKKAVVTFDDGYADNLHTALPILQEMGIPATFFISTGFIGTHYLYPPDALDYLFSNPDLMHGSFEDKSPEAYWKSLDDFARLDTTEYWSLVRETSALAQEEVIRGDPLRRPMSAEEVSQLAKFPGVTLGPHGHTHRRFSQIPIEHALADVAASKEWMKAEGYSAVPFFAYPFGQRKDVGTELSQGIRELGFQPLTTLPATLNRPSLSAFGPEGLPRLSVGPRELGLLPLLAKSLPAVSVFPRSWILFLAMRAKSTQLGKLVQEN